MRDGTFGVTGRVDPLDDELVERIESHEFDPVKVLQWRTKNFDFSSIRNLQQASMRHPTVQGLSRACLPSISRHSNISGATRRS